MSLRPNLPRPQKLQRNLQKVKMRRINHLHDLIANPEDEAVKNLKPEALEGAKATTEMAGGVGAAVLGEKLKSLIVPP